MRRQQNQRLQQELRAEGASGQEARELARLAGSLKMLRRTHRPFARWRNPFAIAGGIVSGLAAGLLIAVYAQTVLPGSWLYGVQRTSDAAAIKINPAYRANVMMHRANQVKQLVARHAEPKAVLAALADYETQAAAYKSSSANYAVFEYCKSNLSQAAVNAPPVERQAIQYTLAGLKNV